MIFPSRQICLESNEMVFGLLSTGFEPSQKPRRKKWIRPDIQLRIILSTMLVAFLALITNFHVCLVGLIMLQWGANLSLEIALQQIQSLLVKQYLISFAIAVPLSIWVGVFEAFKFCGPIYRFKKFFEELGAGRWDLPCSLRKDDELQDLKGAINDFLGKLKLTMQSQQETLNAARAALEEASAYLPDPQKAAPLLQRIDRQQAEIARRFAVEPASSGQEKPLAQRGEPVKAV